MSNRVVLGEFNNEFLLRVSRPGYDVMDDNLPKEALSFDSRWQESPNILQRGDFIVGTENTVTVSFGRTLDAPPMIIVTIIASDGSSHLTFTNQIFGPNLQVLGNVVPYIWIQTDSFSFSKRAGSGIWSGNRLCKYSVYESMFL